MGLPSEKDKLERELAETPAEPEITWAQRAFILDLLEKHELDLRDAIIDSALVVDDLDDILEVEDLTKAEASILLNYLTSL